MEECVKEAREEERKRLEKKEETRRLEKVGGR